MFVDPSAFVQTFIGVAPMKIKHLYRKLRRFALRYGGVVVFFDEADVLGSRGGQTGGGFDERATARTVRVGEVAQPARPARDCQLVAKSVQGRESPRRRRRRVRGGATASSWAA